MRLPSATISVLVALPAIVMCLPEKEDAASTTSGASSSSLRASRKTAENNNDNDSSAHEPTTTHHANGRDPHNRILLTNNHRKLGKLDLTSLSSAQSSAKDVLLHTLGSGSIKDKFVPKNKNKNHLRFVQVHEGMEVEGAALVVHADEEGNVYGVNGEHVPTWKLPTSPTLGAGIAIKIALSQSRVPPSEHANCSEPTQTVVRNPEDGSAHLCWTCTVRYDVMQPDGSYKPFKDKIFAEAAGPPGLVTLFPQISSSNHVNRKRVKSSTGLRNGTQSLKGTSKPKVQPNNRKTTDKGWSRSLQTKPTPSMQTLDCNEKTKNCNTVSTSSIPINTGDLAIDSAHNYAIATFDYFWDNHGRNSIDDKGMLLKSRVHFDSNYNNAFWDGTQMTYGDGDGNVFDPLSQDADVVAHELMHGVTERSSGLIYQGESGALNEAWSDIFGALVDRQEGATGSDLWLLGEDIYTPNTPGDGLRNMADPADESDYDWWPTRYTGNSDNGGVHWNSGIANLAFSLLVGMVEEYNGANKHPRGKSTNVVPIIGWEAAAVVFYKANVDCLTPGSNFAAARYCTADVHGGDFKDKIHQAWEAVGVPDDPPPPPAPPVTLTPNGENSGVLTGLSAQAGNMQRFLLPGETIYRGSKVTCTTVGSNGDADLYLAFDDDPVPNPSSDRNQCQSTSSNSREECTTRRAPRDGTVFIALIHAYSGYSNLSIECVEHRTCDPAGTFPCGKCCNECSPFKPGGGPGSRVCL